MPYAYSMIIIMALYSSPLLIRVYSKWALVNVHNDLIPIQSRVVQLQHLMNKSKPWNLLGATSAGGCMGGDGGEHAQACFADPYCIQIDYLPSFFHHIPACMWYVASYLGRDYSVKETCSVEHCKRHARDVVPLHHGACTLATPCWSINFDLINQLVKKLISSLVVFRARRVNAKPRNKIYSLSAWRSLQQCLLA